MVVRGAGVVCALGVGAAAVGRAIAAGHEFDGFRGGASREDGLPMRAAYPAPFEAARDVPRGLGRRLGRQLGMSLAAVLDAVGTERAWREDPADTGIVASTAHGPIDETVGFVGGALLDGPQYASPGLFASALHSSMAGVAARELGIRGPALVTANGDVSFETALFAAVAGLRARRMRRAVVVGADAFHPLYAASLAQFGLVSDSALPVDPQMRRTTRGQQIGEGAGALVLEWESGDAEGEGPGVRVEDVQIGADVPRRSIPDARVQCMATGEASSARRHADALAACGLSGAPVEYPAARFGAFGSLSAVAIAVEAARRLRSEGPDDARPTVFVSAPRSTNAASLLLAGTGSR